MSIAILLAQAAGNAGDPASAGFGEIGLNPFALLFQRFDRLDILNHPNELLDTLQQIHIVWAGIFVAVGLLSVLNGYKWHRAIVIAVAFIVGMGLGELMSRTMEEQIIVAACVGVLTAVVAWPLMKYAIAVCGGMAGAFFGANLWTALNYPPETHYAGALVGLIAVGMLSFILYRTVILIMTCVAGALILILGTLAMLVHVEAWEPGLRSSFAANTIVIPLIVLVTAVIGFVVQQNSTAFRESNKQIGKPAPKPVAA